MRRIITFFGQLKMSISILILCLLSVTTLLAQQTSISDYVIFGGTNGLAGKTTPAAPGYGVTIGASSSIQGGSIGSYQFIQSTGSVTFGIATNKTNIYSDGKIVMAGSNVVKGNIAAANSFSNSGTALSVGANANLGGNIDVNGNIIITSGVVSGIVTNPTGSIYQLGGVTIANTKGAPALPVLPSIPIRNFPGAGTTNITSTSTRLPGEYANLSLGGNNTLTLSGPGVYVFNSITCSGPNSNIVFDFKNTTSGNFLIYVHGDIKLNKTTFSMINGGSASRIYTETHGTGSTNVDDKTAAFYMSNGSNGSGNQSGWLGAIWAPYAAIRLGSPNGPAMSVNGALWSGTQVNIQSGVNITYARYSECATPNVDAGKDIALDFANQTTLTGSSSTSGATLNWQSIDGGIITSATNAATINVSTAGTYILTATAGAGCSATDTVIVTGTVNDLIGSELQSIYQNVGTDQSQSPFFVIQNDSVFIDIITKEGQYNTALAKYTNPAFGLTNILSNGNSNYIITGLFPIAKLPLLNLETSLVVYVRPYYKALTQNGIVTTAGDISMRSNLVRDGYQLKGEGVKIGVISDSYNSIFTATTSPFITNTAAEDITNGDLPGAGNPNGNLFPVEVLKDYPIRSSDEGRAMLQIVHDIAPKAELYFRTGFISSGDFAAGIDELKQAGCKVIVDDVTYITEPFLKDGIVANAVDAAAAAGVTYFSAAGNFANKSYENSFNPVPAPGRLLGTAHSFNGTDVFQNVTLSPGNYTIVLQWLDDIYSLGQTSAGGTKNDLDIYLTPNTDGTALFGFNRNNTNGDPIEILPFTLTSPSTTNILITNKTIGSSPARFKYIVFRGDITFNEYMTGTSTIVGQANALGAIAVGAARFDKAPPYAGPLAIESFSSIGGTVMGATARNKPDLVAPDGVNTTVKLGQDYPTNSPDGYSNFFGTSAAAPHAAAVAALIMEGKKKYSNQVATSPAEIRSILQISATDMNSAGFDFSSGAGFINADSAMRTFAKPDPSLIQLVIPQNITPGQVEFTLTITGENISPSSVIKFRDSTLVTTFVNSTEATAIVPTFTGDPAISVYTPPVSSSGLDGGTSDSLKFFDALKKKIVIEVDNKSKKYAEQLPVFTATLKVDGEPLENTTLTADDLGLSNLTFTTLATSNSNVGTFIISASRVFNSANPVDKGLLELYDYTFTQGTLTIEKMPLTITPVDKTISYGEYIGDVIFNYDFDQSKVPDPAGTINLIKSYHQGFLPNNALAVINNFSKPQSDGSILTAADLLSLNMMASFEAVKNSRKFTLLNNKLTPAADPNAFNLQYLVDISSESIFNYKNDPATSSFINAVTGISSKAILSANSLANSTGKVLSNGSLVQMVNGSLVQMVNGLSGPMAPILNGSLVQIVNGSLVQLVNGEYVPITNGSLVQMVNGRLVQLVNGEFVPLANGSLVQLVNGSLVQMVNGSLVQLVNGQEVPIVNGSLVQIVNGSLVQMVNGSLVQLVNGSLVQLVNGSLVQVVNGSLVQLVNGSLVQMVNGSLVQLVNGSLVQIVNSNSIGTNNPNNKTAVIFDEADAQNSWIGPMFGINMITGLDAGVQKLVPGFLANENFEISYTLGNVTILPSAITISPASNQSKIYGDADPAFSYTSSEPLRPGDTFSGALGRATGENATTTPYEFTLGSLSAGSNYTLILDGTNKFSITKRSVVITPNPDQNKVYGSIDPIFTYTANEALKPGNSFTGKLGRTIGENVAGSPYAFTTGTLSAGSNYTLNLGGSSFFAITKATLNVKADDKVIYQGDAVPNFTSTITGNTNGDKPTAVATSTYINGAAAGVYPITPVINPFANSVNYQILYTNGNFYVNPKGKGAKKLRPYLDCVEEVLNPSSPSRRFIAHFYCINDNTTTLNIPIGVTNKLSSAGSFDGSQQPFLFAPGTTRWNAPFDGITLKWEITTYETTRKTSVGTDASSTSAKCSNYYTSARSSGTKVIADKAEVKEIVPSGNVNVFPNPVRNRTTIYFSNEVINGKGAILFDAQGKSHEAKVIRQISKNAIEIDMTGLVSGVYFMRIKAVTGYKNVTIIKQ